LRTDEHALRTPGSSPRWMTGTTPAWSLQFSDDVEEVL
jgi:hypothetical protein